MSASINAEKSSADSVHVPEAVAARVSGWQQDFALLTDSYRPYLYRRCMRHLGNPADAEDVLQDVVMNAYRFAHRFERRAKFKTWLTRIADNQCYTFLRQRQQHIKLEHSLAVLEFHETAMDVEAGEKADHLKKMISEVMANVSPKAREVLSLRYWLELSMEEIAHTLGIGLSATKMRLHRAHQQCFYEIDSKCPAFDSRQS